LEARFIGALKKERSEALPIQLENNLVNGKPGYFLKVGAGPMTLNPRLNLEN